MKYLKWKKNTLQSKIIIIVFTFVFAFYAFINVFPFLWSLMNSLKTAEEFFDDNLALPTVPMFINYVKVFTDFNIRGYMYLDMLFNSLWILVLNVSVNVMSSALLAYIIARFRFPGKEFLYGVVIFANTIPIIGAGPADYKLKLALNMINNPATIWLGWAVGFDFAFIVFYGVFKGISQTYSEAAKIDGANNLTVLLRIILPQALPSIFAIAITQAIAVWNNYAISMISLRDYPTLAYGLYIFESESNYVENSKPIYYSAAIISSIPIIVLYASNQKLILENVTAGGLKG